MKITKEYLESLEGSHILICKTPIVLPFSFVPHLFVLVKQNGVINRYEVLSLKIRVIKKQGCVCKNALKPWEGMLFFFLRDILREGQRFGSYLIESIDGDDVSDIDGLVERIGDIYLDYPHRFTYRYLGPNSNTYVRWIIDQLGLSVKLPSLAVGKNYKHQEV